VSANTWYPPSHTRTIYERITADYNANPVKRGDNFIQQKYS